MRINWINYRFIEVDGYGRFGINFIKALHRSGVHVTPIEKSQYEWPSYLRQLAGIHTNRLTIALMPSYELLPSMGRVWNYTMYEGTGLDKRWIPALNDYAERLIVPHQFLVEVFADHGAKVPIHVVPGGTDPQEFPVSLTSPYETGRPYTFLALGDRGSRKGWDLVWQAFWNAFGDNRDVRLLIKMRPGFNRVLDLAGSDDRIIIWREDSASMNEVYDHADCFVFPSRGEGWGMPPREFAMTGKPVICTDWSGLSGDLDKWAIPIPITGLVRSALDGGGLWAAPDVDAITEAMRWCYDNREAARQKGLAAAQWLRANQTWEHAAQKLISLIREIGHVVDD